MKRKAFLINSSVILLLIPLMLLLATYEDVSYQIIHAQSERMQIERTSNVVSSLELNFQKALEISTKRALITTTEYVATKGFISGEMANQTIADLIIWGQSPVGISSDQSLRMWFQNITSILRRQGYSISPSVNDILNNITIRVAPLDSFHIVVIARIPRIKIMDTSGRAVYEGAIPENRNATVIISLEGIEDAFIARETDDFYHRLIRACSYPYPELVERPIKVLNGTGESEVPVVTGVYGEDTNYNATHIWKDSSYITNTTIGGIEVSPIDVLENGDVGVLVFDLQQVGQTSWCSILGYRVNVTINSAQRLNDYQIKLDLSSVPPFNSLSNIPEMEIYYQDCIGPLNYWVERWDSTAKILWVKVNLTVGTNVISIYLDSSVVGSAGDPEKVFDFYDDFSGNSLDTTKWRTSTDPSKNGYSVENGYIKMWGNWNWDGTLQTLYYINTVKKFYWPVVIEGMWRLGQVGTDENYKNYDTDLAVSIKHYSQSPAFSRYSIDAVYDGTRRYCNGIELFGICFGEWDYGGKRIVSQGVDREGTLISTTGWVMFQVNYTNSGMMSFWDSFTGRTISKSVPYWGNGGFFIGISADTDSDNRYGYIDWIRVRKYAYPEPSVSLGSVEEKPTTGQLTTGRAYDIQPLVECLENGYYFGIYNAPSFFERLEGNFNPDRHRKYEELANRTQDLLGISYNGKHYPIGLVSFVLPTKDTRLSMLINGEGIKLDDQTSFDYYFLKYYIEKDSSAEKEGYKMYGVSAGNVTTDKNFYMDRETALAIFGKDLVAVNDLLTAR